MGVALSINTYDIIVKPFEEKIEVFKKTNEKDGSLKKRLAVSGAYLALIPVVAATSAVDTAVGLGAGAANIICLGKNAKVYVCMSEGLTSTHGVATRMYKMTLLTINPDAEFLAAFETEKKIKKVRFLTKNPSKNINNYGLITSIDSSLRAKAGEWESDKSCFKRHLGSRGLHIADGCCKVGTRTTEFMLGFLAAGLSIGSGGKFPFLNNIAFRGLQGTGIVKDLFVTQTLVTAGTTTVMHHSKAGDQVKANSHRG